MVISKEGFERMDSMTSLVVNDITELIGDTPVVRLNRLTTPQDAELYVKLELFNPSGSVKDRAAYNLILQAEQEGLLTPGGTIIEPTSGNTGIGLAMNAAAKGYKAILVMPDNMTKEREYECQGVARAALPQFLLLYLLYPK